MVKNGLYCSGGYDWFSVGSEGNVYTCNSLVYRDTGIVGNLFTENIVLRNDEFQRCPIQMCEQVCDRHWARKQVYKDGTLDSEQAVVNKDPYTGKSRPISILYSPTWKCNYTCKYCHLPTPKEFPDIPDACSVKTYQEWIAGFTRFFDTNGIDGGIAHTNGGEPLYYDGIEYIFEFLYKRGFVNAITTNLSTDIYKTIIQKVPREGIGIINASIHPTDKHFKWDLFKSRIMLLRSFGYPVKVNLVAHPDQVMLIPEYHEFFEKHGVSMAVIPMVGDWSGITFKSINDYPEPMRKVLNKYVIGNLQDDNRFVEGDRVTKKPKMVQLSVIPQSEPEIMPEMNELRKSVNKTTRRIDSSMTKDLYNHVQSRKAYYGASEETASEWLLNRKIAIQERNDRAITLTCKPLYVDMEMNYMCNLKCEFCTCVHDHVKNASSPEAKLTFDEIDQLIQSFKFAEIMETSKGGEPCMTPDLFAYAIEQTRKINPFVIIHTVTNGTAITDRLVSSLIDNKLDHMYVSISGDNQENYHKVMGKDRYHKAIEGLERIRDGKLSTNSQEPYVHFNTQLCKYNDPMKILDLAHRHNVIEVNFVKTQMTEGVKGNDMFKGSPVHHYMSPGEIDELMDKIVDRANALRISINFPGWDTHQRKILGSEASFYYPHLTKYFDLSMTCPTDAPWFRFCTSMRNVQPCCWSGGFADWTKEPFDSIWNGSYLKKLRQQIARGIYPKVCHCKY